MKLYYFRSEAGNFGDDLNLWLWPRLLDQPFQGFCHHSRAERSANEREETLFLGIGTLLNDTVPDRPVKIVFGAGAGYGPPPALNERWRFLCVRGPLTARRLGLASDLAVTDPAVLVRLCELPPPAERARFSYMPHVRSAQIELWRGVCQDLGVRFIHPGQGVERVIAEIRGTEILLTEAMHGAIVADALRVPWVPISSYDYINHFKWQDWCGSLRLSYRPVRLPALWSWPPDAGLHRRLEMALRRRWVAARLRRIMKKPLPLLSSDRALESAVHRLQERLELLRGSLADAAVR